MGQDGGIHNHFWEHLPHAMHLCLRVWKLNGGQKTASPMTRFNWKTKGKYEYMRIYLMNTELKKRLYNANEVVACIRLLLGCCNKFREVCIHFHNAVEVFVSLRTNLVRRYMWNNSKTHSSSLDNAAHMAEFMWIMSKKGLMELGIHLATCRKAPVMIRPGTWWATVTYLSLSVSCMSIFSRTKGHHFGAGSRQHGGG